MSQGVLTPETDDPIARAGPDWLGCALWISVAASLFAGLAWHLGFLVLPGLAIAAVPAARRDDVLLGTLDGMSSLLVDGLAALAALAVSYASGAPTRPMMAWAVLALIGWRAAEVFARALGASRADRSIALGGLLCVAVAWGSGRMPPTADGALAALVALSVATLLKRP